MVLLIKNSLYNGAMYGTSSVIFQYLSNLLRYWQKVSKTADVYQCILEDCWASLYQITSASVMEKIDSDPDNSSSSRKENIERRLRVHQKLINALKSPADIHPKKQMKVNF